jgi:glycine cleavage system H protein
MYPTDARYTKTHEWARLEGGMVTIGITSHASEELSDIVYVGLPSEGDEMEEGTSFATLESVKAVSEVYSPVKGTIAAVNLKLQDEPGLLNDDPYGAGWIARVRPGEGVTLDSLMDSEAYAEFVDGEKGA